MSFNDDVIYNNSSNPHFQDVLKEAVKDPARIPSLGTAQLMARMSMLEWLQEKKVAPMLVKSFEDTLYKLYKPGA